MIRSEIREKFRDENPEITTRVISDARLNAWMETADKEISAMARCIVSNESEIIASVANTQFYDLSTITNFYDIDDIPGGGVWHNDVPLTRTSPAEMNKKKRKWKNNAASDTPRRYWRRGKYLWFDRPLLTAAIDIEIDCIYVSDDFDNDTDMPFNNLAHLEPFHDSISKYLQWRVKQKVGKEDEAKTAYQDYVDYVKWMKSMVSSYEHSTIQMRPSTGYRQPGYYHG